MCAKLAVERGKVEQTRREAVRVREQAKKEKTKASRRILVQGYSAGKLSGQCQ